jgi:hypothetical protein
MHALTPLVVNAGPAVDTIASAAGINAAGAIAVVVVMADGSTRAGVLTPVS